MSWKLNVTPESAMFPADVTVSVPGGCEINFPPAMPIADRVAAGTIMVAASAMHAAIAEQTREVRAVADQIGARGFIDRADDLRLAALALEDAATGAGVDPVRDAAGDMLAALRDALRVIEAANIAGQGLYGCGAAVLARAAIAKAEGAGVNPDPVREAAPAMLAALRKLLPEVHAHLDYADDDDMQEAADLANEAMARAEGKL